jgi:hypothetical protein
MFTVVKVVVSALVIGGINVLARRNPQLGGWVAALPLVSFLSVAWLAVDGVPHADIRVFVGRVLLGLVPTAALLGILALCLGRGLSVPVALGCAMGAGLVFSLGARSLGLLG